MMNSTSLKVQVEVFSIIGDTYPHRTILKQMHCVWNPKFKHWERFEPFSKIDKAKIKELGLKIQHSMIVKSLLMNITPIEALEENSQIEGCIGYVKELESVRSFIRKDETLGNIQRFVLVDQSGSVKSVSWNLVGSTELKNDRVVAIQNATVKKSEGELELHCSDQTKFWIISEIPEYLFKSSVEKNFNEWIMSNIQHINEAHIGFNQKFQGMITDVVGIHDYEKDGKVKLLIFLLLDDQSEVIKVSLFGEMCNELLVLTTEEQIKIAKMTPLDRIDYFLLADKVNNLIGTKIIVKGTIEENEYTKLLELKANKFYTIKKTEECI